MNMKLSNIQRDTSIQTRAQINTDTVNAYADLMTEGTKFPEVVLFGTADKAWIGDGWHRIMAAEQIEALDIPADIRSGGRIEALKYALNANATHGLRRTNADKRRCVEIAVKEFDGMSSRAIAEMCGVSDPFVNQIRQVQTVSTSRTGSDGKQYPATRKASKPTSPEEEEAAYLKEEKKNKKQEDKGKNKILIPRNGLQFARMAIMDLEQINNNDAERTEAFALVREWINENE